MLDDFLQVLGSVENLELAFGAAAALEHGMHVLDLAPAIELVEHVVHEFEVCSSIRSRAGLPVSRPKSISLPFSP